MAQPRPSPSLNASAPTIAIIGGGFSGSISAANLLRLASTNNTPLNVVLIERREALGRGVAYGTTDPLHVLNVPAARMSAWVDQPEHFLSWARARTPSVSPGDFLPRREYGQYVQETLHAAASASSAAELHIMHDEAIDVARDASGDWTIRLSSGPAIQAHAAILAVGHRPPTDPLAAIWTGPRDRFISDPWSSGALAAIKPDEPVLILGSSLTAIDALLSLHAPERARTAHTWLVSRRAMLPHAHLDKPNPPADVAALAASLLDPAETLTARRLLAAVRGRARALEPNGDWRTIVDALRPHTAAICNALPLNERRRFIDRVRPFWEIHRHRMAPHIARNIAELRAAGRFELIAGRVTSATATDSTITTRLRRRGDLSTDPKSELTLQTSWVINCTGPTPSNCAVSSPLIAALLRHAAVRVDELGLGIDTQAPGHAIDAEGQPNANLFVVGTLRKPATWESTAVPELRQQAAAVAQAALDHVRSKPLVVIPTRPSATARVERV